MGNFKKLNKCEISNYLKEYYDIFICSSSFDKRCLSIAKLISETKISNVTICHFENNYESANQNFNSLSDIFNNRKVVIDSVILRKQSPIVNFDLLCSIFSKHDALETNKVLIDITTFTRENLLILIQAIRLYSKPSLSVTLCYTPSNEYPSWLSRGVKDIRSILGYSGDYSPLKKLLLVILTGFENERAQTLIDNYEASKLYIGKASSINSISNSLAEENENHFKNLLSHNLYAKEFEFSCIDIEKTKEKILTITKKYEEDYNVIIAPMNNKLSTLGVAFAALENQNIQICYASTNQYNLDVKYVESEYYYFFDLLSLFER